MLNLKSHHLIGSGHQRHCYLHSQDSAKCVKVLRDRKSAIKHQRLELYYYSKYRKIISESLHVPKYLGEVETNLGIGYEYELVCSADGELARSLSFHIKNNTIDKLAIQLELAKLGAHLLDKQVIFRDFNSSNTVVKKNEGGGFDLVLIDGLGDRIRYSLINFFPSLVRRKIRRRWNKEILKMCKRFKGFDYESMAL